MPEIPRTKFNSPWTVAVIEAALNDVSSAKGSSESLTAALNAMRAEIDSLSGGVHLKGAVDYYSDLPANPSDGDAYTVRYQGTSGTDPLGIEYAWATYQGTPQWIPIGVDPSVFAKATDEAEDRAALVELVDGGAKNIATINDGDNGTYRYIEIPLTAAAGDYVLRFGSLTSTDTDSTTCNVAFFLGATITSDNVKVSRGANIVQIISTSGADSVRVYASDTSDHSQNDTVTISDFMVCSKAEWDISQVYVPHCKTNAELTSDISALSTENTSQQSEIDYAVNAGAKNLLNVLLAENYRSGQEGSFPINTGNVKFSESGGVITTSGTASVTLTLRAPVYLPVGKYYISGCPATGSDTTYRIDLREQGTNVIISSYRDYGTGFEVEITTARTVDWCIRIQAGFDATGLTFSPMIRPAEITDPTFQPYAKTNRELTVLTDEDRTALAELVDGGAKNLCNTDQSDIVKATYWHVPIRSIPAGDYVVSFGSLSSTDTDATTCNVRLGRASGSLYDSNQCERGSNVHVDVHIEDTADYLRIYYSDTNTHSTGDSITASNVMLCSKAAWQISKTYQPYRPSWQEMWDAIQALQNGGNRALTMQMKPTEITEPEEQEER